jgi:hypothetical protein
MIEGGRLTLTRVVLSVNIEKCGLGQGELQRLAPSLVDAFWTLKVPDLSGGTGSLVTPYKKPGSGFLVPEHVECVQAKGRW